MNEGCRQPEICVLRPVIGGFFGHEHVMDVTFANPCVSDPDELSALAQISEIHSPDIAHPCLQAANELFDI